MDQTGNNLMDSCLTCLATSRIMESVEEKLAGKKISDMLKSLNPGAIFKGKINGF